MRQFFKTEKIEHSVVLQARNYCLSKLQILMNEEQ